MIKSEQLVLRNDLKKKMSILFFLNILLVCFMVLGSRISNSLALLSGAIHLFTDTITIGLNLLAMWLSLKITSKNKTYGWVRIEVIAAFLNSFLLVFIAGTIIEESFHHHQEEHIQGLMMAFFAFVAFIINLIGLSTLHQFTNKNLNARAIFVHILTDTLSTTSVIIGGLIVHFFHFEGVDKILSVLISAFVIISAINIFRSSLNILMEGIPFDLDPEQIKKTILDNENVKELHDFHVWSLASGLNLLTCHIVINNLETSIKTVADISEKLKQNYNLNHVTIQVEDRHFTHHKHGLSIDELDYHD